MHDANPTWCRALAAALLLVSACTRLNPIYDGGIEFEPEGTISGGAEGGGATTGMVDGVGDDVVDGSGTGAEAGEESGGMVTSGAVTSGGPGTDGDSSSASGVDSSSSSNTGEEEFAVAYPVPWLTGDFLPEQPGLSGYDRAGVLCLSQLNVAPPAGCDGSSNALPFVSSWDVALADVPLFAPELLEMEIRGPDGLTPMASDYVQLVLGPLQITGNEVTALGLNPGGAGQYWTGSFGNGQVASHCDDWSSSFGPGTVGSMDWGNSAVPAGWIDVGDGDCSGSRHLLCLCWNP